MILPVFLISFAVYKEFYKKEKNSSYFLIFLIPALVDVFSGKDFGFMFSALAFLFILLFLAFKFISHKKIYYILAGSILTLAYPYLALFFEKAVRHRDLYFQNFLTARGFITAFLLTYLFFLIYERVQNNN